MNPKWMLKARALAAQMRAGAKPHEFWGFTNAAKSDEATLYVYEPIGVDFWTGEGCTAKSVVDAIDAAKKGGAKSLVVRILSEGGDVFEGTGIHDALKRCGMKTTAYNDGLCASAATLVALGCDSVVASPTSLWMMHRASGIAFGHASDMRATADLLEKVDGVIAGVYAKKSGMSEEEAQKMMTEEKGGPDGNWMTAQEALDAGLIDEISGDDNDEDDTKKNSADLPPLVALAEQTQQRISAAARSRLDDLLKKISASASRGDQRTGQPGARSK